MFISTTEIAPHVRVSRTVERVAHYARESREHRKERRTFNALASRPVSLLPRLRKPSDDPGLNVIDFQTFRNSRPASDARTLVPEVVVSFDKREAVAQEAGL